MMNNRKFHLRTALVVPFVLEIAAAVGLVGLLSYWGARKAVNDLASQLRNEVTARIEQTLESYFASLNEINQLNAAAFVQGDLDFKNGKNVSQMLQQVKIAPFIFGTYCANQAGEFIGVGREPNLKGTHLWLVNPITQANLHYYNLDHQGNRLGFVENYGLYDARKRPWYQEAVKQQRPVWSKIYLDFTTLQPTLTASHPVINPDGKLIGVCATDFLLTEDFRKFLASLSIGKSGEAFIINRSGQIISSSTIEPLTVGQGENAKLIQATESDEPLIRESIKVLKQSFSNFELIQRSQQFDFWLDGQRQLVQIQPFQKGRDLDFLIVVIVPEVDFMGHIDVIMQNTIGLALTALGLAIALGIYTARWVTRPIHHITQAASKMAQGNLKQQVELNIGVVELEKLASAFNSMSEQLQISFADQEAKNAALAASEARKDALLEAIPDLIMEISSNGIYLDFIAPKDDSWLFTSAEKRIGQRIQDLLPPMLALEYLQTIQQVLQTQRASTLEYQLPVAQSLKTYEARIVPCSQNSALFMVRNITERKQAEEALRIAEENYRSIYENALEGIFQTTPEGRYLNVNPAMARIYGYDSPQEMVEKITDIEQQIYVDPEARLEFKQFMEQNDQVINFEYRTYQKDGDIIWVEENTRAVRNDKGQLLYYEGMIQDVSERKYKETELRRQLEELKIEIDAQKREQEVSLITQSSFFQEIQEEIAEVNLDEFWDFTK
ncbi:histidine kinase [Aphanothece hegewaldii CCALA 016]|uniref:histidine kinase n=1 Tax=Aphanothece hegewaldii CCALA 016 TaxID=2107694 RepID=A0A2T1M084_9CHRO|nr:PAS domain S-box protein [Aphanothece hegewaldii]PSF38057.1 histidine kinase [Aphanothece hegewaldii CCALA 016]